MFSDLLKFTGINLMFLLSTDVSVQNGRSTILSLLLL